ncbi:5325_t:CDS:2, partial [Acaulospora colombiana]
MPPKKSPAMLKRLKPLTYHLEVCIHTILFVRRIYPTELFTKRKIYDAPVYQSRHPDLNKYISGAVKSVGDELTGKSGKSNLAIGVYCKALTFNSIESAMTAPVLAQYFRSFLIRLGMLDSYLGVIPAQWDPTFAVVMEMKEGNIPSEPLTKAVILNIRSPKSRKSLHGSGFPLSYRILLMEPPPKQRTTLSGLWILLSLIVQESEEKLLRVATQED